MILDVSMVFSKFFLSVFFDVPLQVLLGPHHHKGGFFSTTTPRDSNTKTKKVGTGVFLEG